MSEIEEWRDAVDFVGYEVSSHGRVRRSAPGRRTYVGKQMSLVVSTIGYHVVGPTVNGKNKHAYVHDMVCAAFIGPKPDGCDVNHIDGVKTNNRVSNLEYVTHRENMRHAARTGLMRPRFSLSEESQRALASRRREGASYSTLAKEFRVSLACAWNTAKRMGAM